MPLPPKLQGEMNQLITEASLSQEMTGELQ
jgi:hypothetical protein